MIAPAPGATPEDQPKDQPSSEPDTTSPVGYQAAMKVAASGKTFDQGFGSQVMCAMMENARGDGAVPPGAVQKDLAGTVATASHSSKTARTSAAVVAALLALFTTALVVRTLLEKKTQPQDV
jgi:hypothetical protein